MKEKIERNYKKFISILCLFLLLLNNQIWAQQITPEDPLADVNIPQDIISRQPPMENVFLNVLWGSMSGGLAYMGLLLLDDSVDETERFSGGKMFANFVSGATLGGMLGLGFAIFVSYAEISFPANRLTPLNQYDYSKDPTLATLNTQKFDPSFIIIPVVSYSF